MSNKLLLSCCLILTLVACQKPFPFIAKQHQPMAEGRLVDKMAPLPYFTRIEVAGDIDVQLIGGNTQRSIRLIGAERDVTLTHYVVKNEVLYVNASTRQDGVEKVLAVIRGGTVSSIRHDGKGKFTAIDIDSSHLNVQANQGVKMAIKGKHITLRELTLSGASEVSMSGVNSPELTVNLRDSCRLTLTGMINLREVKAYDNSVTKLYWINSPYIRIHLKQNAQVKLAGKVKLLEVDAAGHSHFNGRYLRTGHSYIKTVDEARADVQSTRTQQTLARDHSTIFYYEDAPARNDYMENSGAVLEALD